MNKPRKLSPEMESQVQEAPPSQEKLITSLDQIVTKAMEVPIDEEEKNIQQSSIPEEQIVKIIEGMAYLHSLTTETAFAASQQ